MRRLISTHTTYRGNFSRIAGLCNIWALRSVRKRWVWERAHKGSVLCCCSMCSARSWSKDCAQKSRQVLRNSEAARVLERWRAQMTQRFVYVGRECERDRYPSHPLARSAVCHHCCDQWQRIAVLALKIRTTRCSEIYALGNCIYYMASARRALYSFAWNVLEWRSSKLQSENFENGQTRNIRFAKDKTNWKKIFLFCIQNWMLSKCISTL